MQHNQHSTKFQKYIYQIILFVFLTGLSNIAQARPEPWVGNSFNGMTCRGSNKGYGPHNYTNPRSKKNIHIVEQYHFNPLVQYLKRGATGSLSADLDYTLIAVPNHHKALLSIIRYQLKLNNKLAKGKLKSPVECYLQRAMRFAPKDPAVPSLYGYYLHKLKKLDEADEKYQLALQVAPDAIKTQYSYALLLIDKKQHQEALVIAKKIYAQDQKAKPEGLKNKLIKLGVWQD